MPNPWHCFLFCGIILVRIWGECSALPRSLHTARYGGIPHLGGISIIKQKEAQKIYDMKNKGGQ